MGLRLLFIIIGVCAFNRLFVQRSPRARVDVFKGYTVKGTGQKVTGRWEPGGLRPLHLLKNAPEQLRRNPCTISIFTTAFYTFQACLSILKRLKKL